MDEMRYISVILPLKLEWEPCYRIGTGREIPDQVGDDRPEVGQSAGIEVGQRVRVRFAGKEYVGVVSRVDIVPDIAPEKIQPVLEVETSMEKVLEEEKKKMCELVSESGADFIKTSTGFSTGGATREDIILFSKYVAPHVKIKAAGGISSIKDAEDFISLGASRLGTSRIVKIVEKDGQENGNSTY